MIITTKDIYEHCYGRYAVPAVNVAFMEQIHGLFAAAQEARAPFIVQTTPGQRNFAHPKMILAMISAASEIYPDTIYAVNLDHGNEEHIRDVIKSGGYTSVMIDASHEDFETNIKRTRDVCLQAHEAGISVESELGVLSRIYKKIPKGKEKDYYTDPDQAEEFIQRTGCDSLAIAVGTSHGAYKFSGGQGVQFEILAEIQRRIPGFPLVLHGASSIDKNDVIRINNAGGKMKLDARGVDPAELEKSIDYGICKVNIATDFRILWTRVQREFMKERPEKFTPTIPASIYMKEYKQSMIRKFELLKTTGQVESLRKSLVAV